MLLVATLASDAVPTPPGESAIVQAVRVVLSVAEAACGDDSSYRF